MYRVFSKKNLWPRNLSVCVSEEKDIFLGLSFSRVALPASFSSLWRLLSTHLLQCTLSSELGELFHYESQTMTVEATLTFFSAVEEISLDLLPTILWNGQPHSSPSLHGLDERIVVFQTTSSSLYEIIKKSEREKRNASRNLLLQLHAWFPPSATLRSLFWTFSRENASPDTSYLYWNAQQNFHIIWIYIVCFSHSWWPFF